MSSVTKRKLGGLPTPTESCLLTKLLYIKGLCNFLCVKLVRSVHSWSFIRITDNFVQIISLLEADGDLFPDRVKMLEVNLCHDDVLRVLSLGHDLAPGTDNGGVAPGNIGGLRVPGGAGGGHPHLVIKGPGPGQQLPVSRTLENKILEARVDIPLLPVVMLKAPGYTSSLQPIFWE